MGLIIRFDKASVKSYQGLILLDGLVTLSLRRLAAIKIEPVCDQLYLFCIFCYILM